MLQNKVVAFRSFSIHTISITCKQHLSGKTHDYWRHKPLQWHDFSCGALLQNHFVAYATFPNHWKATKVGVCILEERMTEAMTRRKLDVIVIECMDDNCYYGLLEDGSTKAATSGDDGFEHFEGRLVVGKKDAQDMLFRRMEPIWEATKGTKTIIVIPRKRFVVKACCDEAEHVSNRMEPNFITNLRQHLSEMRISLKRYLNSTGRSQCQVMDPNVDLAQVEVRQVWGEDAIYPLAIGYDKMATGLLIVEEKIGKRLEVAVARANKRPRTEVGARMEPRAKQTARGRPGERHEAGNS
jgi:hypothetical protein